MSAPVVTIFKNGDNHFQGKRLVVNRKEIRNFEALLDKITKDTRSQIAVRSLRTPNHGHKVQEVDKLENGGVYVAVGPERFKKLRYNEIRALPVHQQKVEGQVIKPVVHSRVIVSGRARKVAAAEPLSNRIIQVYRNGDDRNPAIKILLDKRILKSMDNVLQYVSDKVALRTGAVRSLYSIDGVVIDNANQLESGHKYVAVGFGKKFLKVHYSENAALSLTPRRATTKYSHSPEQAIKRRKPRRLKTHPQDRGARENKYQSSSGSERPTDFETNRVLIPSEKSTDPVSSRNASITDESQVAEAVPGSRKNSDVNESDESVNIDQNHNATTEREKTFDHTSPENVIDPAEIVDADDSTKTEKEDDVFKATGSQSERAKAVKDDQDTNIEKPIDMQAPEEVDEEIENAYEPEEITRSESLGIDKDVKENSEPDEGKGTKDMVPTSPRKSSVGSQGEASDTEKEKPKGKEN